jgi:hypothetical protein
LIAHGCYVWTVCDVCWSIPSSKFSVAPAFYSRLVKFSVAVPFPQTPPWPPLHTHTPQKLRTRMHAHTHTTPPSLETLARSPPPRRLHCQKSAGLPMQVTHRSPYPSRPKFLDGACQTPPFPHIPILIPIPHSRVTQPKPGYASRVARGATVPKEVYRGLFT